MKLRFRDIQVGDRVQWCEKPGVWFVCVEAVKHRALLGKLEMLSDEERPRPVCVLRFWPVDFEHTKDERPWAAWMVLESDQDQQTEFDAFESGSPMPDWIRKARGGR